MRHDANALTFALIARVPSDGVDSFRRYEAQVLPLLADHGGRLERRLSNGDGTVELHILSFRDAGSFAAFRSDPRRASVAHLLEASGARTELLELYDVN